MEELNKVLEEIIKECGGSIEFDESVGWYTRWDAGWTTGGSFTKYPAGLAETIKWYVRAVSEENKELKARIQYLEDLIVGNT